MSLFTFAQESRFLMPVQKQRGKKLQACGELTFQQVIGDQCRKLVYQQISQKDWFNLWQEGSLGYFSLVNGYFPNRLFLLRIRTLLSKTKMIYKEVSFYTIWTNLLLHERIWALNCIQQIFRISQWVIKVAQFKSLSLFFFKTCRSYSSSYSSGNLLKQIIFLIDWSPKACFLVFENSLKIL